TRSSGQRLDRTGRRVQPCFARIEHVVVVEIADVVCAIGAGRPIAQGRADLLAAGELGAQIVAGIPRRPVVVDNDDLAGSKRHAAGIGNLVGPRYRGARCKDRHAGAIGGVLVVVVGSGGVRVGWTVRGLLDVDARADNGHGLGRGRAGNSGVIAI